MKRLSGHIYDQISPQICRKWIVQNVTSCSVYLVATVFVQDHQHQSHDDDHSYHDGGVQDGVESSLCHSICVFRERCVDPVVTCHIMSKRTEIRPRAIALLISRYRDG